MMEKGFVFLIRIYQIGISPYLGSCCRFFPSCSEYAKEAFIRYGVIRGIGLSFRRLMRCHPACKGGVDFLP